MTKPIEIIYLPEILPVFHCQIDWEKGLTVQQAINKSGLFTAHPETKSFPIGIFSKPVAQDTQVNPGDRIEIYRPLTLDPKEIRRKKSKNP